MPRSGETLQIAYNRHLMVSYVGTKAQLRKKKESLPKLLRSKSEAEPGFNASYADSQCHHHHHMNTCLMNSETVPLFWRYLQATGKKQMVPANENEQKKRHKDDGGHLGSKSLLHLSLVYPPRAYGTDPSLLESTSTSCLLLKYMFVYRPVSFPLLPICSPSSP